jgi:hypothetical protein
VCLGKVPGNSQGHYKGPGPHPADVIQLETVDLATPANIHLPPRWTPQNSSTKEGATGSQLVICLTPLPGHSAATTGRCMYAKPGGYDLSLRLLVDVSYQVTVRTADTGRQLRSFELKGDASDRDSCPNLAPPESEQIPRIVSATTLVAKLKPLLDGTAS